MKFYRFHGTPPKDMNIISMPGTVFIAALNLCQDSSSVHLTCGGSL